MRTTNQTWTSHDRLTHRGGCDCGAVRYELALDPGSTVSTDDISLSGGELLVRAHAFTLLAGEDTLSGHQFASSEVHHFYCERCGRCSFTRHNVAQQGAEFYAVDLRCLDLPRGCCLA